MHIVIQTLMHTLAIATNRNIHTYIPVVLSLFQVPWLSFGTFFFPLSPVGTASVTLLVWPAKQNNNYNTDMHTTRTSSKMYILVLLVSMVDGMKQVCSLY